MSTKARTFLTVPRPKNKYEKSQYCIIQEAGALLAEMVDAAERLRLEMETLGNVDGELCVELFEHFAQEMGHLVEQGEQLAADESDNEDLREQIRCAESDISDLSYSIADLRKSSIDDLVSDIDACEEEADRICQYLNPDA